MSPQPGLFDPTQRTLPFLPPQVEEEGDEPTTQELLETLPYINRFGTYTYGLEPIPLWDDFR
jgi:hypothetical protein